jgi:cytochrome P450
LIQAGADTTGSSLGSTLRSLLLTKPAFVRARAEIDNADRAGLLSHPIQYEETRRHLPFFVAVIKEGMRLHPPTSNVPARVVPPGGLVIDGHFVPGGTDVTSHAYTVQRDRDTYGDDADEFRPERWLESEKKALEYDAGQMLFGAGFRVCLGKDVAIMELYKVLPEIVRRFDIEVVDPGRHIITGGAAWNVGFMGKFIAREM